MVQLDQETTVKFIKVSTVEITKKLLSKFDQKLNYHYNLIKREIDAETEVINEKLVNLSKVLQNPEAFGEQKDMVLVKKLGNDHKCCDQVLSKITDQFKRLQLINLDSTLHFPAFVKNSAKHRVSITENFEKLQKKLNIARTLLARTENRLLGKNPVENDQFLLERLNGHGCLRSASFARLENWEMEKLDIFRKLNEVCFVEIADFSTDQATDIFSNDLKNAITETIRFGELCTTRFLQLEQELSREKAHLMLTVDENVTYFKMQQK